MSFDPLLAFFAFGVASRVVRSGLELPKALYDALTLILLLSIGLKGGVELHQHPAGQLLIPCVAVIGLGIVKTLLAYGAVRFALRHDTTNSAAIAAHYGSVSVGTYAVASAFFKGRGIEVEGSLAVLLVVLEAPAIAVAVWLARPAGAGGGSLGALLHEMFLGKGIVLLLGGLCIGAALGERGLQPIAPVFFGGFRGALSLFMIEMGIQCASQASGLRRSGLGLAAFGIVMPLVGAGLGGSLGAALGLSLGGTAMLATLAASASYIAVPAAMRLTLPAANPALSLGPALGVTFPFNVTLGVPLYLELARRLH